MSSIDNFCSDERYIHIINLLLTISRNKWTQFLHSLCMKHNYEMKGTIVTGYLFIELLRVFGPKSTFRFYTKIRGANFIFVRIYSTRKVSK